MDQPGIKGERQLRIVPFARKYGHGTTLVVPILTNCNLCKESLRDECCCVIEVCVSKSEVVTLMVNRRTTRRYELSLPVIVRGSVDKEAASLTGKTRDISSRGVYFTIDNKISAGTRLDLTMILPAEVTGGTEVLIKATGRVIRVDTRPINDDQKVDVAAILERYEIIRNEATIE
jgi:hypothetical protein